MRLGFSLTCASLIGVGSVAEQNPPTPAFKRGRLPSSPLPPRPDLPPLLPRPPGLPPPAFPPALPLTQPPLPCLESHPAWPKPAYAFLPLFLPANIGSDCHVHGWLWWERRFKVSDTCFSIRSPTVPNLQNIVKVRNLHNRRDQIPVQHVRPRPNLPHAKPTQHPRPGASASRTAVHPLVAIPLAETPTLKQPPPHLQTPSPRGPQPSSRYKFLNMSSSHEKSPSQENSTACYPISDMRTKQMPHSKQKIRNKFPCCKTKPEFIGILCMMQGSSLWCRETNTGPWEVL